MRLTRALPLLIVLFTLVASAGCELRTPPKNPGTAGNVDPAAAKESIKAAKEAIKLDHLDDARKLMTKVIEQDPSNAQAFMLRGIAYMREGKSYPAVKDLAAAAQIEPTSDRYYNLGTALHQGGFYKRAALAYQAALEMRADDPEAMNNLASSLLHSQRISEAQQVLQRVIQMRPNDPQAHTNLGITYEREKDYDAAEQAFFRALNADPNYYPAQFNLAKLYDVMGEDSMAAEHYSRYLKIRPDAPDQNKIESRILRLDPDKW